MNVLNGFSRPQGGRRGGVRRLWLVAAADVLFVNCTDPGFCGGVVLKPGADFSEYVFGEGSATYDENIETAGGPSKVVHRLVFGLPLLDAGSAAAWAGIASASWSGIFALLEDQAGGALLVGYSETFGYERPLRLLSSSASTGKSPDDTPLRTIVLGSEDTSPAMQYTGPLP